jgi:tetratricopeptide (TPR) repeat protein
VPPPAVPPPAVLAPPLPPPAPPPRAPQTEVELERPDDLLLRLAQASLDTEEVLGEGLEPPPPEQDGPMAESIEELPAEAEQRAAILGAPEPLPDLPPPPESPPHHPDLADELEEAEFFAQQGLLSEAREALHLLLDAHPGHPAVEARLAEVDRRLAAKVAPMATRAPVGPPPDPRAVRQSPSLVDPAVSAGGNFDIGAELAEELDRVPELGLDDEFQYSVEDVFNQFKRGVAETVTAEDSDTHYDLGIAYKEMGLVDDAVNEFETALRGNNRKKEVDSLSMVALCRMSQGRPRDAIDPLRRALRSDYLNKENAKAIHFELGLAHEELGERDEALWCFHKVVRLEATYRDVATRIAGLGGGPGRAPPGMATPAPRPLAGLPRPGSVPQAGAQAQRPSSGILPAAAQATRPLPSPPGPKKNIGFL